MDKTDIKWESHFTKGWTDECLWKDYMAARDAHEFFEMDCLIRAQGAERRPTDSRVVVMNCQDLDLLETYRQDPHDIGSSEKQRELQLLEELAGLRDVPLAQLPTHLDESLRKLSYFAHHIQIRPYVAGVDYMTTQAEYDAVQAGKKPAPTAQESYLAPIQTGRDLATYVHKDNPMKLWSAVVKELLDLGVPYKDEFQEMCREDAAFATWGMPFWWGVIGEIIGRTGPVNFRSKHEYMAPRPEEHAYKQHGFLLPMAFSEGSPMHGSYRAMHEIIADACAAAIVYVFDKRFPIGDSDLETEILLLGANVSDGRQWAAVHFEEDNRKGLPIAKALGERVVKEKLGEV